MIWHCFHCSAAIAFIDARGEIGPTMDCTKLHVIGGAPLYCCRRCGAAQIPSLPVCERLLKLQQAAERRQALEPVPA
jgi:hypothetical protein